MKYSHGKFRISIVVAQLLLGTSMCVDAATITVESNSGGVGVLGECVLRDAIRAADTDTAIGGCPAGSGADTITFDIDDMAPVMLVIEDTFDTKTGLPIINSTITIEGDSTISTTIQRDTSTPAFRIFQVQTDGKLTLNNVTVKDGNTTTGGGILSYGDLTLNSSTVTGNHATDSGGGIAAFGAGKTVSIQNSNITNNSAGLYGGGMQSIAPVINIANSTISDNIATGSGGGALILNSPLVALESSTISGNVAEADRGGGLYFGTNTVTTITDTTISNNTASGSGGGIQIFNSGVGIKYSTVNGNVSETEDGGGIFNHSGTLTLTNSTISNNRADSKVPPYKAGGGIFNYQGSLDIENSTINNNSAKYGGGGIHHANTAVDSLKIKNTIIANSMDGDLGADRRPDTFGNAPDTVNSNNLILNDGGDWNSTCTNCIIGADPLLKSLANNGGPTWTNALQRGSPAIDSGDPVSCIAKDQRYQTRDSFCDIGAFEYKNLSLPAIMYLLL